MGQQDGDYLGDYLDTVTSGSDSKGSQDGTLPLPPTDDSGSGSGSGSSQSVNYKDLGKAAATRDFQQAHGDGWEYDVDAMIKQIERLEDIRDKKLQHMFELAGNIVNVTPPANEGMSKDFIKPTDRSGESHNTQLQRYHEYLGNYIDTLEKIDKAYQDEDDQAAQELLSKEI